MRVLYVGNFEPEFSTENDVRKAFEALGHEVIKVQENAPDLSRIYAYNYQLLLYTGTWDGVLSLPEWLDVIHECAVRGISTATLHLDTFWGKSRGGRKWWRENMFHTAYLFTADGDYQEQWQAMGKKHIWLPPAVRHDAAARGQYREVYACDVAFVGSNGDGYHEDVWGYRKELVDALRDMCAKNGWTFKNPGGDQPKIERSMDMNDFYASAKVTVGDSLCLMKENSHYWSDRVPEALGRGGFLIMPHIKELDRQFPDIPQYEWGDYEGLEATIAHWLQNAEARTQRTDTLHRHVAVEHTYLNRAQTIIDTVVKNA